LPAPRSPFPDPNVFTARRGFVRIFGFSAWIEDGHWVLSHRSGHTSTSSPTPVHEQIQASIEEDISRGRGDDVCAVHVSPATAARLILEGAIPETSLAAADTQRRAGRVLIPDVTFGTSLRVMRLPVVVRRGYIHVFATVDAREIIV